MSSSELLPQFDLTKSESGQLARLRSGGESALAVYFDEIRSELHRMVRLRLDQRLQRRVDESDVIQEGYVEACKRLKTYLEEPHIPPSAWIRRLVRQIVSRIQREHMSAQRRDIRREQNATSMAAVDIAELSATITPPDARAEKGEQREKLIAILSSMPLLESEILTLVHFEGRTVREAAAELDIKLEAAKKRYRRAIIRLKGWIN